MLTGHGNIQTAVEAMKMGAYDFIPKPPDLNRLLISVRNALESKNLAVEKCSFKKADSESLSNDRRFCWFERGCFND